MPLASRSATRASPLSSSSSADSTASRISPLVAVEMPSRALNAALTVDSRADRDIEISLGRGGQTVAIWKAFVGIWGVRVKAMHRPGERQAFAGTTRLELAGLAQPLQEPGQVVGDVIDISSIPALQ